LQGIFSERDYARKVHLNGLEESTPVVDVMTPQVLCASPHQSCEEIMSIMVTHSIRHMPVVEDNKIIAVISLKDVVRSCLEDKDMSIQNLQAQILGRDIILEGRF
jgi:IMP dehydrogenase